MIAGISTGSAACAAGESGPRTASATTAASTREETSSVFIRSCCCGGGNFSLAASSRCTSTRSKSVGHMTRDETIAELVLSNHILYDQGVVDGFGHVSVRDPADPGRFLLSRSKAPVLVGADDIRT